MKNKRLMIFAVHVFMATHDMHCAVCNDTIKRADNYMRIEPKNRKRESFIACLRCGGKVKA